MKDQLKKALEPIGWSIVERASPAYSQILLNQLVSNGGRVARNRKEAADLLEGYEEDLRPLVDAIRILQSLDEPLRRNINTAAEALDRLEQGQANILEWGSPKADFVEEATVALWHVMAGIEAYLARLESEAGFARDASGEVLRKADGTRKRRKGLPLNAAAYEIADTVARVFVIGTGEAPRAGRLADGTGLSGPYGKAVEKTLLILGHSVSDAFDLCHAAVSNLSLDDEMACHLLRCPLTRDQIKGAWEKSSPIS